MKKLISLVVLAGLSLSSRTSAAAGEATGAPPRTCEINLRTWCITPGAKTIVRDISNDGVHDRTWQLQGSFSPESKLMILEPNGCKSGYADQVSLMKVEDDYKSSNHPLVSATIRLKSDKSCDLKVLFPKSNGDPMEWAFSTGLALIWACRDRACTPIPLANLKPMLSRQGK